MKPDYDIKPFKTSAQWRQWLKAHHASVDGIWIRIYKKATGITTIDHAAALDQALCFGWIDGQRKAYDDVSFLQKFTPRRTRSLWSKRNIEYIERLTNAGLMTPAGVAEVVRAQQDGRWQAAYDKPSDMTIPKDFLTELHKNSKANDFYKTLNKTNTYAIAWRLQTAKTSQTRTRRLEKILAMLEAAQKLV